MYRVNIYVFESSQGLSGLCAYVLNSALVAIQGRL